MRSYALAIALTLLLSAFYVYQNPGDVSVSFFAFNQVLPQGIWEALLFGAGVLMMWLFSILASLESWSKSRAMIKERDKRISELEAERASLVDAISRVGTNATQPDDGSSRAENYVEAEPRTIDAAEPPAADTTDERKNDSV